MRGKLILIELYKTYACGKHPRGIWSETFADGLHERGWTQAKEDAPVSTVLVGLHL
jgi:hypothetical protein